jgi:hypothetical protein
LSTWASQLVKRLNNPYISHLWLGISYMWLAYSGNFT